MGTCSSYRAERVALIFALREILERGVADSIIYIFTDSLSNLQRLQSAVSTMSEEEERELRSLLRLVALRNARVVMHFIKGHAGHAGNEIVDQKCTAGLEQVEQEMALNPDIDPH